METELSSNSGAHLVLIQKISDFFFGKPHKNIKRAGEKLRIFTGTHYNLRPLAKTDVFGCWGAGKS